MFSKKPFSIFIVALLIAFSLIAFYYSKSGRSFFKNSRFLIGSLSQSVSQKFIDLGKSLKVIGQISGVQRENQGLKKELNEAKTEIFSLNELKVENELLKKQLNFSQKNSYEFLPAQVTFFDPTSFSKHIFINKGKNDGIVVGMPVLSGGVLIGKVSEADEKSAKVILVFDPSFATTAQINNLREAIGILKGQLGFGLNLEKISKDIAVKNGDLVFTSGLGGDFPAGLLIGKIEIVKKQEDGIFQEASVKSDFDLGFLKNVFILIR